MSQRSTAATHHKQPASITAWRSSSYRRHAPRAEKNGGGHSIPASAQTLGHQIRGNNWPHTCHPMEDEKNRSFLSGEIPLSVPPQPAFSIPTRSRNFISSSFSEFFCFCLNFSFEIMDCIFMFILGYFHPYPPLRFDPCFWGFFSWREAR